jgi:hypothetical protein
MDDLFAIFDFLMYEERQMKSENSMRDNLYFNRKSDDGKKIVNVVSDEHKKCNNNLDQSFAITENKYQFNPDDDLLELRKQRRILYPKLK